MTGYPFIENLFKNVLQKSKSIGGRFFVSTKHVPLEINSENLDQVLTDAILQITHRKYPLVMMPPPRARGIIKYKDDEFQKYSISTLWLKTSYYNDGQITNVNPNTQTSLHTIPQDWHDMKRCAENFIRVLDKLQKEKSMLNYFRLPAEEKLFTPLSSIGADRASGVKMDFMIHLFSGCELEDYKEADISSINIPALDPHPEHKL